MTATADRARITEGYRALRTAAAWHPLERDVLSVSGPDAASYLQGQCSQDVSGLGPGDSAEALLLSPQGKIDAYLRLTRRGEDAFVLDTDRGFGPVVLARLERFRLRTQVVVEPLDWVVLAVRGPEASAAVQGAPPLVVEVAWPGHSGVDLLGPPPARSPGAWVDGAVPPSGPEAWEAARIEAGVPVNGREVVEGSIAAEVGLVERTVSFTKGCFTGQELVARLDARGSKVARRLAGVVLGDDGVAGVAPVGASVFTEDGEHRVGALSSVAWSPGMDATVALATLHRRVTPPQGVRVQWGEGAGSRTAAAQSRPLPLVG